LWGGETTCAARSAGFSSPAALKITPEQADLRFYAPTGGCRGCAREEVALLAGISIEYCTWLERGYATGVSDDVLDAIVRALQLDDVERAPHRPGQDGPPGRRRPGGG